VRKHANDAAARAVDIGYQHERNRHDDGQDEKQTRDSTLSYGPGIDGTYSHNEVSIVILNRLGLITPTYTKIKTFEPGGENIHGEWGPTQDDVLIYGDLGSVVFTTLGEAFCEAVMPDAIP
jgi:hypothetical protein